MKNIHRHFEKIDSNLWMTQISYTPISPNEVEVHSMNVYPIHNGMVGVCVNINNDSPNNRMIDHAHEMMRRDGLLATP